MDASQVVRADTIIETPAAPARQVPVYAPSLIGRERDYVLECLDSTWISSKGRFISSFENGFAAYAGVPYATSVCNGTVALHLALVALGIGRGDEVIVPTLTYVASANAVTYTGAKPVFVDCRPGDWQLDPADVARKITPRTKAVMAVHLYGSAADLDALASLCARHGLALVEDCAEAIGTLYKGRHVGGFGHVSAFSFFGNKTITTGEGGMVLTTDADLHDRIVRLRGQGLSKHREYWHDLVGYNYRMTNICAAIGTAQLERVHVILEAKRALAALYREMLRDLPLVFQVDLPEVTSSFWMICILTETSTERDALRRRLAQDGIETRPLFPPVHQMPIYDQAGESHPVSDDVSARGLNLPSWPGLSLPEVTYICQSIRAFYASDAARAS